MTPQEFRKLVTEDKTVLIMMSDPLDFDSIGSGLVMKKYLESLGKEVSLRYPREIKDEEREVFNFLPYFDEIIEGDTREILSKKNFDLLIFVDGTTLVQYYDCSESQDNPPDISVYDKRIRIDHHFNSPEPLGTITIHSREFSCAAEIIFKEVIPQDFIDEKIATLIYGAIVGDTGNFCWNFRPDTLKAASFLLEKGAEALKIIDRLNFFETKDYLSMLAFAAQRVEFFDDINTLFVCLSYQELQKSGINDQKYEAVKKAFKEAVARKVRGFSRGILVVEEKPGKIHVSARGNSVTNKISLPTLFTELGGNGGGHFNAAGMDIESNFVEFKDKLIGKIEEHLKHLS